MEYKCPHCGKTSVWEGNKYRPFCSKRCKMTDLGAWADEKYKVKSDRDDIDIEPEYIDEE